jgi:hypothetical protein
MDPNRPIEKLEFNSPDSGWAPMVVEEPAPPEEWRDPTPVKTPEQLQQERLRKRIEKATKGWPWNGAPQNLVSLVWILFPVFLLSNECLLAGPDSDIYPGAFCNQRA